MSVIALVGLPGSGKSTVSRHLARTLQCAVLDTDAIIEEYLGCSISDYFARAGEAAFRQIESKTLQEVLAISDKDIVLATGGGIILRSENRQRLQTQAFTVYLHAQPQQLYQRLRNDRSRPLLQNTNMQLKIKTLYTERHAFYEEVAALRVESSEFSPQAVADQIVQNL